MPLAINKLPAVLTKEMDPNVEYDSGYSSYDSDEEIEIPPPLDDIEI